MLGRDMYRRRQYVEYVHAVVMCVQARENINMGVMLVGNMGVVLVGLKCVGVVGSSTSFRVTVLLWMVMVGMLVVVVVVV